MARALCLSVPNGGVRNCGGVVSCSGQALMTRSLPLCVLTGEEAVPRLASFGPWQNVASLWTWLEVHPLEPSWGLYMPRSGTTARHGSEPSSGPR